MHNLDDKYPVRSGFKPVISRLQAPGDTNEPSWLAIGLYIYGIFWIGVDLQSYLTYIFIWHILNTVILKMLYEIKQNALDVVSL